MSGGEADARHERRPPGLPGMSTVDIARMWMRRCRDALKEATERRENRQQQGGDRVEHRT